MKIKFGDSSLNLKAGGSLANIDRGPRGYSAYEIAVQEGFVGTEEEWLASLVGPEGKQGKEGERGIQGPRGQQGIQGIQGVPGYTPVKGVDYFTESDIESLNIPDSTSDLTNDSGFITNSVNNLTNYTLKTNTGSLIDLSIDNTNYVVTLKLKNQDGTVISTDNIDLPLESVVVGGRYDSTNKKIVLTLENGNTVDIPVGDLIAGLQTEITSANKLASDLVDDTNSGNKFTNMSEKQTWNNKYNKPSGGIPKTDLSSDVQTSLGKADTALQEHQDLSDYVKNTDYATANKGGVIKTDTGAGVDIKSDGRLQSRTYDYNIYSGGSNNLFISKGTLENVIAGKGLINQSTLDESQAKQDTKINWLQTLVNQMPTVSGQGTDLSLENVLNYRLMKFLPQGVSSQESTDGKNLLNLGNIRGRNNGVLYTVNNGKLNLDGACTSDRVIIDLPIQSNLNGTYTFSTNYVKSTAIKNSGGTNLFLMNTSSGEITATINDTPSQLVIYALTGITFNSLDIELQIESGSSATTYEPYTGGVPAPNPSYPYPVKSVTGENSLVLQNVNLFDSKNKGKYFNSSNKLIVIGSADTTGYINASEGDQFTITSEQSSSGIVVASFDKDYNCLARQATSGTILTHTCPANTKYIIGSNYIGANTNTMLVKGSTAPSTYVEHEEQIKTLSLGNIELASSTDGTIRDGIIGIPNNWFKREYIGKVVLDGTQTINKNSNDDSNYLYYYIANDRAGNTGLFSDKLSYKELANINGGNTINEVGMSYMPNTSNKTIYFNVGYYLESNTTTAVRNYFAQNNTSFWYEKAQYTDIPITDTTLINQLNDIYNNAHSHNGITNITTTYEDGNEQMYIEAEALMDINSLVTRIQVLESEV